jgi:hypothetical protein
MITAAPIMAAEHRIMSSDESAFLIFSLSLRLAEPPLPESASLELEVLQAGCLHSQSGR